MQNDLILDLITNPTAIQDSSYSKLTAINVKMKLTQTELTLFKTSLAKIVIAWHTPIVKGKTW